MIVSDDLGTSQFTGAGVRWLSFLLSVLSISLRSYLGYGGNIVN